MNFNHYFTNDEITRHLKKWVKTYPILATLSQIGSSHEKRPIWLLTLTNQQTGAAEDKPALWIDANIHATELAGSTTAMYIAHKLLTGYGKDPQITRLLDHSTYYIVPRVNPDGAALAMSDNPKFVRSGVRPYPWEDKDEGLHVQDIDGNGRILQMRIPDPNGDWKVSPLDSRLMAKRDLDEATNPDGGGTYYRLLPEGLLEDFDGYVMREARDLQGLDFNRNFPYEWKPENEQYGAGPYPTSEPEIRTLAEFVTSHLNINIVLTFHTFSRVLLRPYSTRNDETINTEDLWVFKKMGARGTQLTGYRNVSTFHDFTVHPKEVTYGAFDDWMYDHLGAYSFTVELWDLPTEAGIKERSFTEWWRDHPHEQDVQILKWIDEHGESDSYYPWQPFEHPQLGKIELGGWNTLYSWRNPPHAFMEAEAARHLPWVLSLSEMLPRLSIHTLEVTPLGEANVDHRKNYRINLVVENVGFLSTHTSQQAKTRRCVRPARAELILPEGAEMVNGKRRVDLGHLEGRSNKMSLSTIWASSPTDNRARVEWVIRAPEDTTIGVNILSERAGSIRQKVTLR
jgi:murein tripeptide amidase MpaA